MRSVLFFLTVVLLFACNRRENEVNSNADGRYFSEMSFWNQPLAADAKIDDRSGYWIGLLERDPSGENFGLNIKSYTIPIYEVDSDTIPFQKLSGKREFQGFFIENELRGHLPRFDSMGVPVHPSMESSPGGDKHLAIIDRKKNLVWDMFWVLQMEHGSWISATGMVYPLDGEGVFDPELFDVKPGESIHAYGPGVAAGMPIVAGVIRYDEVVAGKIRHKLCGALRYVAYQEYVFPATWTDGNFEGGIPEGATIQLDPDLDLSGFDLTDEEILVAKALQEYGLVIVDFSAGSTIRAEYLDGSDGRSWDRMLRGWEEPGGIKTIPLKHYRVLEVGETIKGGDRKKEFFTKQLYFRGDS